MATQEITTQVSSARAKQLVASVVSAFQSVRNAQSDVQDAQEQAIYARPDERVGGLGYRPAPRRERFTSRLECPADTVTLTDTQSHA